MQYTMATFDTGVGRVLRIPIGSTVYMHTDYQMVLEYTEVVSGLLWWADYFGKHPNVGVQVSPSISNTSQEWEVLTAADSFGWLITPGLTIKKLEKVARFLRYTFGFVNTDPGSFYDVGINAAIMSIARFVDPELPRVTEDEYIHYLNGVRTGFTALPPPGAGRIIPFLPNCALANQDDGSGAGAYFYSQAFPTHEFSKLAVCLEVEGFIGARPPGATSKLDVSIQTSIDKSNWFVLDGFSFTQIAQDTSFPSLEFKFPNIIGAWTRCGLKLTDPTGGNTNQIVKSKITGIGLL